MDNEIGILFGYGPQGKSIHFMEVSEILKVPNVNHPNKYKVHYSITLS